jgi:phospholipid/cholesterol/gamma-HCH transport system substrate-binding protein
MNNFSRTKVGVVAIGVLLLIGVLAFNKAEVGTRMKALLTLTDTISADFGQNYKLVAYNAGSDVKMAGVVVGQVVKIGEVGGSNYRFTMQLDDGLREKLGTAPTATIRATLLLGGRYYIDLAPGGQPGTFSQDVIPVQRTSIPTELYDVLNAVGGTQPALQGIRSSIDQPDGILRQGGTAALRSVVQDAPATLKPGQDVLHGLEGTQPSTDWTNAVVGLRNTAAALTDHAGKVESIIDSVDRTSSALAAGSRPLTDMVGTLPETMRTTRAGLADLQPTLDQLVTTAHNFRDSAKSLSPMLAELDPALRRARPVLHDLHPVVEDARQLLNRVVPSVRKATDVFDDLSGAPLDRVNGPLMHALYSPFKGTGPYEGGGSSGNPLYKELGYLSTNSATVWGWHDQRSAYARVIAGGGPETVGGVFDDTPNMLAKMGLAPQGPSTFRGDPGALGDPQGHDNYQKPPFAPLPAPNVPQPKNPLLTPFEQSGGKK